MLVPCLSIRLGGHQKGLTLRFGRSPHSLNHFPIILTQKGENICPGRTQIHQYVGAAQPLQR